MTLVKFLGLCVAGASAAALMNFLLKQISREYIKKIAASKPEFARAYRSFMQFMVRNHRFFGTAAGIVLVIHAGAALLSGVSSLTGAAAGVLLLTTAGIGWYGYSIRKNPRGRWIHIHRGAAFLLAIAVITHIMVKYPLPL